MNCNLKSATDDFRKTHLLLYGHSLGLTVKMVRELNLCFYHDGKLPLLLAKSITALLRSNSVNLGELRGVRRLRDYGVQGLRD